MNTEATVQSHLDSVSSRINDEAEKINNIAGLLHDHADRLHGPADKREPDSPSPTFSDCATGRIEGALYRLSEAVLNVAYESGRNTNIA